MTEYANDLGHRDLEVDKGDGTVTTMKRYVHAGIPGGGGAGVGPAISRSGGLGSGLVAQYGVSGGDTRFFHADLVGTTRMMTDSSGAIQTRLRWTAFGEPLPLVTGEPPYGYEQPSGAQTRYGYAGSWGYQNDGMAGNPPSGATLDIGLLHVGARYYDPAIGRFVMRDPISVFAGANVYSYVRNSPHLAVDPSGGWEFNLKTAVKVASLGLLFIGTCTSINYMCHLAEEPNLRDDPLYGGEDGTPITDDSTTAGGEETCDQMDRVKNDVEGAAKMPGGSLKGPGGKPGRP